MPAFRQRPTLITADSPEFVALYGPALAAQIGEITASPERQEAAREEADRIEGDKRRAEMQVLHEVCEGADNKVYGKEGLDIAARFPAEPDGKRTYYMQVGLHEALKKAGLLRRGGKRR